MPSTISAGTTAGTAVVVSGDTTGVLQLQTNGTTAAMTIDTSQNVGIGVAPSAWSAYKGLNIGLNATLAGSTGGSVALLSTNAYFDGSSYKYITTDAATQYQQNTGQHIWRGAASGTAGNTLTFTQILALERTKSLALEGASSQSGTGITFPATQSASTDANTLDDYEEGTWTPTGNGITYSTADGSYTKIGRVVIARFTIVFPSTGSGSIARLSGLPFTSTSSGTNPTFGGFLSYSTHGSGILVQILDNTSVIQFDDLASNAIQNSTLSTKSFRGVVTYFV